MPRSSNINDVLYFHVQYLPLQINKIYIQYTHTMATMQSFMYSEQTPCQARMQGLFVFPKYVIHITVILYI